MPYNKDETLYLIKTKKYTLDEVDSVLRNDKEIVISALSQDGDALRYASLELQNNIDVVKIAIENNYRALAYASNSIKNNRELILDAVVKNGTILEYASSELQNDKDIVLLAVQQDVAALTRNLATFNLRFKFKKHKIVRPYAFY